MNYYSIAGLLVGVDVPVLPKAFEPFAAGAGEPQLIFLCGDFAVPEELERVDSFTNDAGKVELYRRGDWYMSLQYGEIVHWMRCSADFSEAEAKLDMADPFLPQVVSSMLRIAFSQRVIYFDGISVHASAVVRESDGLARLFLGRSGMGKSTHSALWMKVFSDAWLLNDDNPVIRIVDGSLLAFGTPWSGKTPCYRSACAPVQGMVRLFRGDKNSWQRLRASQAWLAIFPSCSFIAQDESLYLRVAKTANFAVASVVVGNLACRKDENAALTCYNGLCEAASEK